MLRFDWFHSTNTVIKRKGLYFIFTMSVAVEEFLSILGMETFVNSDPRPPLLGEENERSTASKLSNRSYLNVKQSNSFSTSVKTCLSSHHGDMPFSHSPCGTPRKSNLNRNLGRSFIQGHKQSVSCDDVNAPLGFEPEGSVDSSPMFTEGSPPPYMKWAESLEKLLDDKAGVQLFMHFLDKSPGASLLEFHYACKGVKLIKSGNISEYFKVIYRMYLKGEKVLLKADTKKQIMKRLKLNASDPTIYDEAMEEVTNALRQNFYPLFLKSDIYLQHVHKALESPKTSNNSSGSDSCQPLFHFRLREKGDPLPKQTLPNPKESSFSISEMSSSVVMPTSFTEADSSNIERNRGDKENDLKTSSARILPFHPETEVDSDSYHRIVLQQRQRKQNRTGAQEDKVARSHPDQFYAKLKNRLELQQEKQNNGQDLVSFPIFQEGDPFHYKSLHSSVSSDSMESLKTFIATSDVDTDIEGAQSILDQHLSQTFDDDKSEDFGHGNGYWSSEEQFSCVPVQHLNCTDGSSYVKMRERLLQTQKHLPPGAFYDTNSDATHAKFNASKNNTRHKSNFQPPPGLQQRVQYDLVCGNRESSSQLRSNWLDLNINSLPKSKSFGNQFSSQSDSEMLHHRTTNPAENGRQIAWRCSDEQVSKKDQDGWQDSYFCSQPNLQDPTRRRTMLSFGNLNESMPSASLPLHQEQSTSLSVSSLAMGHRNARRSLMPSSTNKMPLSSMPPPTFVPPPRAQPPLTSSVSNAAMGSSSSASYYQGFRSKDISRQTTKTAATANQFSISGSRPNPECRTVVSYYFCDEPIPYRTTMPGRHITLAQFKAHLAKKGNYRYFFKKVCDEFESGVVHEEVYNDNDILPLWEGKVFGKVERKLAETCLDVSSY